MWKVSEKGGEDIGVITFASGKLESTKYLLPLKGADGMEFGRQLYLAMRDLEIEGNSECVIETGKQEGAKFAEKSARLHCGKKTILLLMQKLGELGEYVQLEETLEAR